MCNESAEPIVANWAKAHTLTVHGYMVWVRIQSTAIEGGKAYHLRGFRQILFESN